MLRHGRGRETGKGDFDFSIQQLPSPTDGVGGETKTGEKETQSVHLSLKKEVSTNWKARKGIAVAIINAAKKEGNKARIHTVGGE